MPDWKHRRNPRTLLGRPADSLTVYHRGIALEQERNQINTRGDENTRWAGGVGLEFTLPSFPLFMLSQPTRQHKQPIRLLYIMVLELTKHNVHHRNDHVLVLVFFYTIILLIINTY